MKNLFIVILTSLFLFACKSYSTVRYTPPITIDGVPQESQDVVAAGQPLQPVEINWYGVLFYSSLILFALWLFFKGDGGEDKNHNGIEDSSETEVKEEPKEEIKIVQETDKMSNK